MSGNTFSFSHLIGLNRKSAKDDEDEARKVQDDDVEDDPADDDEQSEGKESRKSKKVKGKKVEDDSEDDPDAEDDEEETPTEDGDDNKDVKKGRRAERQRCARIFSSQAAAGRPDVAAHLAFNTTMSAHEAISLLATLKNTSQGARVSLDARMREEQQVRLGQDAESAPKGSAAELVQKMTQLYNGNQGRS